MANFPLSERLPQATCSWAWAYRQLFWAGWCRLLLYQKSLYTDGFSFVNIQEDFSKLTVKFFSEKLKLLSPYMAKVHLLQLPKCAQSLYLHGTPAAVSIP